MKKEIKRNPNRVKKIYLLNIIALCILVLLSVLSAVLIYQRYYAANRELRSVRAELEEARIDNTVYTEEEMNERVRTARLEGNVEELRRIQDQIRNHYTEGESTLGVLRELFEEELVVRNGGTYSFVPIRQELDRNPFKPGDFLFVNGTVRYVGSFQSVRLNIGIDVSEENGEVDWEKVYASGVRFAYIRAGVRGYASGAIVKDDFFDDNITKAAGAGLKTGTYFFSQAVDEEEARKEADFVLECVKDKEISCPIAYDLEKIENYDSPPRTKDLSKEQMTKNAIAFCERIKEAGYTPIIYGNIKTFMMLTELSELEEYQKWFADYITGDEHLPYFPYEMMIWQYSEKGSVPGVEGDCDLNIGFFEGE